MTATSTDPAPLTEDDVRREYGYVAMVDGTRLAYVLWRPAADGRYPTILSYSAYYDGGASFEHARRFVTAGYAFLSANVRGTGSSEGAYSYYQPIEGPDGAELVEWAARQPWSTGNVGMVGASYGGHTQIKVAAERPPHLRAIVPVATEGSEFHDEGRTGGLFNAGLLGHWTFTIQPDLARAGAESRVAGGDVESTAIRERQPANRAYYEALEHPLYDDWWRARTLDFMAERVEVPTLIMHSWQDEWIRPSGATRMFGLFASEHKRMVLQNGAHGTGAYAPIQAQQMRWLDRWVKGEPNGAEEDPAVTVMWEVQVPEGDRGRAVPGWTTTYPTWPVPELTWSALHLTEAGGLSPEPTGESDGDGARRYLSPLGTELVGSVAQFALVPHPLGTLSYRTEPMVADVVILGSPRLAFHFSCEQTDTDFMFTLKDVDPEDNALFLQRSVLRASMRAIDEDRSSPAETIHSFAERNELVPGEVYDLTVSLSVVGHVVRAGHRLELSILAPGTVPNPIWGFLPVAGPSMNTVFHSDRYPATLHLPVLPGEAAQAPVPPFGTLENQPYRLAP
jgi:putative CocE/NonD family hydrolase